MPARVLVMVVVLILLGAAGITAVTYLKSPAGHARLLDMGRSDYYPRVQRAIDGELRAVIAGRGLDDSMTEMAARNTAGQGVGPYEWYVLLPAGAEFIDINLDFTEAARRGGGRVRESIEKDEGRTLFMVFGTRRHDTHRVTIAKDLWDRSPPSGARADVRAENRRGDGGPRVAIVIDDFGYSGDGVAQTMMKMDLALTVSILPGLPHSQEMLKMARREGRCTLLHLPMEAEAFEKLADTESVKTSMTSVQIERVVKKYLDAMPGVDGVNNHQGSYATTDHRVMWATLVPIADRKLFFVDSLTSPKTIAYNTARELGIPTAQNNVFLDGDTQDPAVVGARVKRLVQLARENGSAIAIGHPHPWTLEGIENSLPILRGAGVELVPVCELVQ